MLDFLSRTVLWLILNGETRWPTLISLLIEDEDPRIRAQVALSLPHFQDAAVLASLAQAVHDQQPRVAFAALRALAQFDTPQARRVIEQAAKTAKTIRVRQRAQSLLKALDNAGYRHG